MAERARAGWSFWLELALPSAALVIVAAVAAAPAGSAVAASSWVHGAFVVVGIAVLALLDRLPRWLDLWLAVLCGLAAEHRLLFMAGTPWGNDAPLHLWGAAAIAEGVRQGDALWLHRLGAGVPLLQFYPPAGFAPIVLGHLAGLPLHAAFRLGFALFGVVAAVGMQRAVWRLTASRSGALVAAAALAFAPYRLMDAHRRSALGETAAMAVLPWVVLGVVLVLARRRDGARSLGLAAAVMLVTHVLTALVTAYAALAALLAHLLVGSRAQRWRQRLDVLRPLAGAAILALCLAAIFLLPLAADLDATSVGSISTAHRGFVGPGIRAVDLLGAPRDAPALRSAIAAQPWRAAALSRQFERMPLLPFGTTLSCGLLLLAVQLSRRLPRAPDEPLAWRWSVLAMAVFTLALSLDLCREWFTGLPLLPAVQFSWRGLTVASVVASFAVGLAVAASGAGDARRRALVAAFFLAAVVFEGWFHAGVGHWLHPWQGVAADVVELARPTHHRGMPIARPPARVAGWLLPAAMPAGSLTTGRGNSFLEYSNGAVFSRRSRRLTELGVELVARSDGTIVRLRGRGYAEWLQPGRKPRRLLPLTAGGGRIVVDAPAGEGTLMVREQCFPGWRQRRDRSWEEASCRNGFLAASLRGPSRVEWRFFAWRWPRVVGALVSLTTLICLGLATWSRRQRWPLVT